MNSSKSDTHNQHQRIQLLLPWYVNESLPREEYERVHNHVRHCLVCHRELISLRKLSAAISQSTELEVAAERSFANLSAKLPRQAASPTVLPHHSDIPPCRPFVRFLTYNTFRYAIAASLMLAIIPLGLRFMPEPNDASFYTLSSVPSAVGSTGELRVVFAKSTSAADITAALSQLHGQQVGETNSVGALTIRLDAENGSPNLQQAIVMLRDRHDVVLAEPVLQP